jgi:hypothetical protein
MAGLAGCGGSSEEENATSTVPEEVEDARDEYNESEKEQGNQDTATPEPNAEPLAWISTGGNGQNNRYFPSYEFNDGEYTSKWAKRVGGELRIGQDENGAEEVIAGGGRIYVLKRNDIAAYDGLGERIWAEQDPTYDNLGYADGRIAGTTSNGGVFIADAETGERDNLLTDVGEDPVSTQTSSEGYYAVTYDRFGEIKLTVVDMAAGEVVIDSDPEDLSNYTEHLLVAGEQVFLIGYDTTDDTQEYPMRVEVWNAADGEYENGYTTTWLTDNSMEGFEGQTMIDDQLFVLMGAYDNSGLGTTEESGLGLLAFSSDGSLNWAVPDVFPQPEATDVFTNGSEVCVVADDTTMAYSVDDGSKVWEYSTRQTFAPDAGIISEDHLLIPDRGGTEGIRVHNIETGSGEASRTQLYSFSDDEQQSLGDVSVHIRPATSGIYSMAGKLRHLSTSSE